MFKPGSIRKVIVKSFVTYSFAEFKPGPNLNLVIGPNGTGKSTLVAAIILGLGGYPKTVGRGSKISEYVKLNYTEATIEITLQGINVNDFIQITREFNVNNQSTWKLNNQKVSFKDVESVIKQFNIQVDNLCQFLPQDRLQDFAKMNKQQLLQHTQSALCREDLIEKQTQLINFRDKHKTLEDNIKKYEMEQKELQDANLRMESKVQNLRKKKKYLKAINDIKRKIAWINYEELRLKLDEIKQDKAKALEVLNKHKDIAKSIEKSISNAEKLMKDHQQLINSGIQKVRERESTVQRKLNRCNELDKSVVQLSNDLAYNLRQIETRKAEVLQVQNQMNALLQDKSKMIAELGDNDNERMEKLASLKRDKEKLSKGINNIQEQCDQFEYSKRSQLYKTNSLQTELNNLENVKKERLNSLYRVNKLAYVAVEWLEQNRRLFRGRVFDPIMLELNVLNPSHAVYIERTIPLRDRVAFCCELKEDMNLLITKLREEKKLRVNVLCVGTNLTLNSFQPKIPIEQLKPYGMFAYLRSLVTGPDLIMIYLCKTYHLHRIPVGNELTNQRYHEVPPDITIFYSKDFRFSISYSKYTKQKNVRQIRIRSDGTLQHSLDMERIQNIKSQLDENQNSSQEADERISRLKIKIEQLKQTEVIIRQKIQSLDKLKDELKALENRISIIQSKLRDLESNSINEDELRSTTKEKIKGIVELILKSHVELEESFKAYRQFLTEHQLNKINLDLAQSKVINLKNENRDILLVCSTAEETLQTISHKYLSVKREAQDLLQKGKDLSKGFTPMDDGFNEFKDAYDSLSNDIQVLEKKQDSIVSKIDCLNTATSEELAEYETREEQIEKLKQEVENGNIKLNKVISTMDELQKEWLDPLQQLISQINKKFSSAFELLKCAGEITLTLGENEKDFSEYGLSVNVKFRDSEPLKELNSGRQSGGERAVTTAIFMLSLQEVTPVPFRCVDEINQGMDVDNERRIFNLLVDVTSNENTAQYFLITPKLVHDLKYSRHMTIHFIHNGPFVPNADKWFQASKICNT